jgi:ATP-dependent RNA helicase DDX23/PRP28
MGGVDQNE